MTTYISIGNFTIQSTWIAILLAGFFTSIIYRIITRSKVTDWFGNGFFYYLFTWKLSYLLFYFPVFWDSPISVLYFSGGTKGHFLGIVILTIYLLFRARKRYPSIYEQAYPVFLMFMIINEVLVTLFNKNYLFSIIQLILLIILLLIFISVKRDDFTTQLFVIFLLVETLTKSMVQNIFSISSITFLWIGFTLIILCEIMKTKWVNS